LFALRKQGTPGQARKKRAQAGDHTHESSAEEIRRSIVAGERAVKRKKKAQAEAAKR
jgi:hypothetical protein